MERTRRDSVDADLNDLVRRSVIVRWKDLIFLMPGFVRSKDAQTAQPVEQRAERETEIKDGTNVPF